MRVLVTGCTGTLGSHLLPILYSHGHEVIGFSRCELKQRQIPHHDNLTLYLGDIRDRDRLIEASRGCEVVYHLAALKQVDKLEENPEEAIATNIRGTANVLHAQRVNHIRRVVLASTDKAVHPVNVYGATKMTAERLVLRNPANTVCRYGNVLASRGSVVPMFVKTLRERGVLEVTDKKMTRYWITPEKAAEFVFHSSIRELGGLCIPPMKAYPVVHLGMDVASILGIAHPKVETIGIRAGEKLHECLRTEDEGGLLMSDDRTLWYQAKELREVLTPIVEAFT